MTDRSDSATLTALDWQMLGRRIAARAWDEADAAIRRHADRCAASHQDEVTDRTVGVRS